MRIYSMWHILPCVPCSTTHQTSEPVSTNDLQHIFYMYFRAFMYIQNVYHSYGVWNILFVYADCTLLCICERIFPSRMNIGVRQLQEFNDFFHNFWFLLVFACVRILFSPLYEIQFFFFKKSQHEHIRIVVNIPVDTFFIQ